MIKICLAIHSYSDLLYEHLALRQIGEDNLNFFSRYIGFHGQWNTLVPEKSPA